MSDWLLGLVEVRRSDMVPEFLGGRADRSLFGKRHRLGSLSCPSPVSLQLSWHGSVSQRKSSSMCVVPREQCDLCTGTFQRFGLLGCTSELLN